MEGGDSNGDLPPVVLVHLGSADEGASFLAKRWPGAVAVADPNKVAYEALGLVRGTASQVFGLRVFKAFFKAATYGVGRAVGDTMILAGSFVVRGREVLAAQPAEHAGDLPEYSVLARVAQAASGRER